MKLRLIEIECEGAAVSDAVRAFGQMFRGAEPVMTAAAPVAAAPIAALPAPAAKAARPVTRRGRQTAKPAEPRTLAHAGKPVQVIPPRWADKPTLANVIRERLKSGAADIAALTEFAQANGFPEATERQIGNNAYQLRRKGDVSHRDDGKYSLAEK